MSFPEHGYEDIGTYADHYFLRVQRAARALKRSELRRAADVLSEAYRSRCSVFVFGNGGSAAIANHLACDHLKGARIDTELCPRVVSLSSNIELISAISNDIGFEDVFVYQLRALARAGDVVISVSSSGDSENVVRAVRWARDNDMKAIAFTGFTGGRSGELADIHLHVEGDNYGVIEDVHQSVMHILAQYLRQACMTAEQIADRKF